MHKSGTILRQPARSLLTTLFFIASLSSALVYGHEGDSDQRDTAKKPKPLSADIYEKEDTVKSFSAHVNLIRETDTIEVFFDGNNKGPYILKDDPNLGVFKEKLIKSQKNKNQNVTVKINEDVITSVELTENKAATQKKSDMDSVLDDILKK